MTKICTTMDQSLLDEVEEFLRTFPAAGSRAAVIREALRFYLDFASPEVNELVAEAGGFARGGSLAHLLKRALEHWVLREREYHKAAERLGIPREQVTHREISQARALIAMAEGRDPWPELPRNKP